MKINEMLRGLGLAALVTVPAVGSAQRADEDDRDVAVDVDVETPDAETRDVETPESETPDAGTTDVDTPDEASPDATIRVEAGTDLEGQPLPPQESRDEPYPPVAAPMRAEGETGMSITSQAGVGSTQAYGRMGVVELGGSLGFGWAEQIFQFNISPQVGVFIVDNFQLSAIVDLRYVNTGDGDTGTRTDSTRLMALVEPSYHHPFDERLFFMVGLGLGVGYNGQDAGLAIVPRVGLNMLVGRSGILTPAASLTYVTQLVGNDRQSATIGANIGYSVMW